MKKTEGLLTLVVLISIFSLIYVLSTTTNRATAYNYTSFMQDLDDGLVTAVIIKPGTDSISGTADIYLGASYKKKLSLTDTPAFEEMLREKFPAYTVKDTQQDAMIRSIAGNLLMVGAMIFVFMVFMSGAPGGGGKMAAFSRGHIKISAKDVKTDFAQVAGLDEEKEELKEIVDFLKNPRKYLDLGARIPKGVLMEGPPGTGKTLLAKAVAGEAGVPFFTISGSDFVEMFVGVGASRVRDLFDDAKQNAPCIVFIDEIDAVARRRGTGMGGSHDEREQTLNQLLVEMDGFSENQGLIVLAATNRVDILDPAIMRAGRFDRKVTVSLPDVKGRLEILKVHSKNKPLAEDVNLDYIAKTSAGMAGADLENLMNEAAIIAAKNNRKYIMMEDIKHAFIKTGVGVEKHSRVISARDKEITAYHEVGHAILFHLLDEVGPVYIISVIPTGPDALGYTMPLGENDDRHLTRLKLVNSIKVALGGRIAEQIRFDDYTAGASQDIKQATATARNMVMKFGMSDELGMVNYADDSDNVFIGRDLARAKSISEETAAVIDKEVRRIISECYDDAKRIILENRDVLDKAAAFLVENERMTKDEFEALFKEN
ncbi:MAG: ATP-dependent zinc metalloprotease FtsH [Lachnospiraceae bacterium]|nr:ATP-dependent zinc metalloprotease FtsH [Lachnospiraceae bacterium]